MKKFFGKKSRSALALVIMVSLGLHVVAIIIFGMVTFASTLREKEKVFKPVPATTSPPEEVKNTIDHQRRNEATPPPRPQAIVVNNPSEMDIPALDIDVDVDSSSIFTRSGGSIVKEVNRIRNMELDITFSEWGTNIQTKGSLEATLIDLKRDRSGKPTSIGRVQAIREFTDGSWNLNQLTRKYYSAENKLYGSYWMIPNGPASKAPKAFGVEDEIEPSGIAAFYEGSYTPPRDMEIRLCGMADDVLIVRLNSRIILDASWQRGYSDTELDDSGPKLSGIPKNIRYGEWIKLRAGEVYDLKILLSEIPGGAFCCFLFYQEKGDESLRVFTTRELGSKEKRLLRDMGTTVANAL